ncbi:glycoside hydrolase family 88 protein [Pseudonocardia sp. MH-G8]|uniref:glycoside hydrolase family 88 protein n=1 Tax=Pseudonocardia sp. MH-G8 TaxID=1854588 RepID=UPI0013042C2D|nr:glycoside hydrolase family 88 protein [Pseudonocardia sp. MH-G8]
MNQDWSDYLAAARREERRTRRHPDRHYPHCSEKGAWELLDASAVSSWDGASYEHGNWTAGFWFGTMWLAARGLQDDAPADRARAKLIDLRERACDHTTHDLGFLFHSSLALGYQCGFLDEKDVAPALDAARMTVRRFNEPGRYIQAFGPVGELRGAGTSTIDTLMNLPLLWWAHDLTGDPRLLEVARQHARTSARLLVRPDGSTVHLMDLDPVSGAFLAESTLQGASPASAWSRGSGWAICGLAWAYAACGEPELLAAAERAAAYYERMSPLDAVPPWDFADRSAEAPPDASAGAAVALGYLILGTHHPDPAARDRFDTSARQLLATLTRSALNRQDDVDGVLLHSCYSVPHGRGVDGATAWGDFYYALAMAVAHGALPLATVLGGRADRCTAPADAAGRG